MKLSRFLEGFLVLKDKRLLQLCDFEALDLDWKCNEKRRLFNFLNFPFVFFFKSGEFKVGYHKMSQQSPF